MIILPSWITHSLYLRGGLHMASLL